MKNTDKLAAKVLKEIMYPEPDSYGWPPVCYGLFHQPERPVPAMHKKDTSSSDHRD